MRSNRRVCDDRLVVLPSGKPPERRVPEGTRVRLEPERHGEGLYIASHADEQAKAVWTYLPDGPFDDPAAFKRWAART